MGRGGGGAVVELSDALTFVRFKYLSKIILCGILYGYDSLSILSISRSLGL